MEIVSRQFGQNIAETAERGTSVADREKVAGAQPLQNPLETEKGAQQRDTGNQTTAKETQARQESADKENSEEQQDISLAVEEVQTFLQAQNRNLAFSIDEETQRSVVTVKDAESGDVIRQIPSEEVLKLAQRIQELQEDVGTSVGVFVNKQV